MIHLGSNLQHMGQNAHVIWRNDVITSVQWYHLDPAYDIL